MISASLLLLLLLLSSSILSHRCSSRAIHEQSQHDGGGPAAAAGKEEAAALLLSLKAFVCSDPLGLLSDLNPGKRTSRTTISHRHHSCRWRGVRRNATQNSHIPASDPPPSPAAASSSQLTRTSTLSGTLSPAIANLSHLRTLSSPFHSFVGPIPPQISSLPSLQTINLRGNRFSGPIPAGLGRLAELKHLNLPHNSLEGEIPPDLIVGCTKLEVLVLDGNRLSRKFLGILPRLRLKSVSNNELAGAIPSQIAAGNCRRINLELLDVSGNRLSGDITAEHGDCTSLSVLVLNNYNGHRRTSRSPVKYDSENPQPELRSFVRIPSALSSPVGNYKLRSAHAGLGNRLRGRVMVESSSAGFLRHRRYLRAMVEPSPADSAAAPSGKDRENVKSSETLTYAEDAMGRGIRQNNAVRIAAIAAGSTIGLVMVVLVLAFLCLKQETRGGGANAQRVAAATYKKGQVYTFQANLGADLVTYESILRATGGFSLDNLIGSGGFGATYKAELKPGFLVAVKKIILHGRFVQQQGGRHSQEANQQFEAEIRTLGTLHHPNLVTLLGYYCNKSDMFLFYNYLPGGNLESLIHGDGDGDGGSNYSSSSSRNLEVGWSIRYKIAMDIAKALAYLHDECVPRILHRDIKPSNVLLDHNLNAFLSDFGLARLLSASETHVTTDHVLGTYGYVAPEYLLQNRVSDKADVYSYGVLLLELISGKKVMDRSFSGHDNGFDIVVWSRQLHSSGKSHMVFAAGLWEQAPEAELMATLKLALRCTNSSRSGRPTMKQVVETLRAALEQH